MIRSKIRARSFPFDFQMLENEDFHSRELMTCPYDQNHRIMGYRMVTHLLKCSKNHPNVDIRLCPFNSLHHIEKHKFAEHIQNCASNFHILDQPGWNEAKQMVKDRELRESTLEVENSVINSISQLAISRDWRKKKEEKQRKLEKKRRKQAQSQVS
ncbi:MAG: factor 1 [Marteilia pararefringens]